MTGQVQCPNCGGYKVSTETKTIGRKSGNELPGCGGFFLLFLLSAGGWLGLVMFINAMNNPFLNNAFVMGFFGIAALGGPIFTVLFIWALLIYLKVEKIEKYYYTCLLCGYKWSRREDEPLPPVTVRPDLIIKGEQKLEEEERERRRRDEEAAAWAHYQRQKRK